MIVLYVLLGIAAVYSLVVGALTVTAYVIALLEPMDADACENGVATREYVRGHPDDWIVVYRDGRIKRTSVSALAILLHARPECIVRIEAPSPNPPVEEKTP